MEHIINVASGVLAALTHDRAKDFFHSEELAYGLAGVASLCFSYLAATVTKLVKRSRFYDWRFKAVGMWIETVDHHVGRQYTISMIRYDAKAEAFLIVGTTFSPKSLEVFSDWRSMAVNFSENDSLYYLYSLKNFQQGPDDVIGLAHMSFFATEGWGRRFFDGKGYFLDKTSDAKEVHYTFERLTRKLLADTIGKSSMSTAEDRRKLLLNYSKRNTRPDIISDSVEHRSRAGRPPHDKAKNKKPTDDAE